MADRPRTDPGTAAGGLIRPMLATPGRVPGTPGWAFEIKFDGVRAIGYAGPAGLRLLSRNDRDISFGAGALRRRRARHAGRAGTRDARKSGRRSRAHHGWTAAAGHPSAPATQRTPHPMGGTGSS
jgi:hypothetical protein